MSPNTHVTVHDNDVDAAAMIPSQASVERAAAVEVDLDEAFAEILEEEDLLDLEPTIDIGVVWADFKASGSLALREQLILHYAPLVTGVAGRVGMRLPSSVEQADLVSYGMFGLIDAIEKYSLDRAVKFETYATARIRGAIIDELRAIDWIP